MAQEYATGDPAAQLPACERRLVAKATKRRKVSKERDDSRFNCPFPGCDRSCAELWRLKVHYRAPPDNKGSGVERGHDAELEFCPRCDQRLEAGKHHIGCRSGLAAPRQALKREERNQAGAKGRRFSERVRENVARSASTDTEQHASVAPVSEANVKQEPATSLSEASITTFAEQAQCSNDFYTVHSYNSLGSGVRLQRASSGQSELSQHTSPDHFFKLPQGVNYVGPFNEPQLVDPQAVDVDAEIFIPKSFTPLLEAGVDDLQLQPYSSHMPLAAPNACPGRPSIMLYGSRACEANTAGIVNWAGGVHTFSPFGVQRM